MKYNIIDKNVVSAITNLIGNYGFDLSENGVKVNFVNNSNEVKFVYQNDQLTIYTKQNSQIFWALKEFSDLFSDGLPANGYQKAYNTKFDDLTYMLDCSRNAVYKLPTIKKVISQLAVSGYNSFMLYTEDTFKLEDYPYFGYLRNPFTKEDIKEIDEYCKQYSIELIPCIQTLGHFGQLIRYPSMANLFDIGEVLLVGEEETYKFIESMIKTCAKYFSSRKINIGMDEAYMLGRGKYLDKNGYHTRYEIMEKHLKVVNQICAKYGFKPMMWSDMFFSLTLVGDFNEKADNETLRNVVPPEIELIYWDYYHLDKQDYNQMMAKHKVFNNKLCFATGAWKWLGFTPDNAFSFKAMEESAKACQENGIGHYIVTGWGDNGAETSCFAVMPAIYYAGYINYHDYKIDKAFEKAFNSFANMPLKDFLTIDLANRITTHNDLNEKNSANKYLLFNDILLGTLDTIIERGQKDLYNKHAKVLHKVAKTAGEWAYIFKTQEELCKVLAVKCELGLDLREAYQKGDKQKLAELLEDVKKLYKLVDKFYDTFNYQWHLEAKPNGFDVQDVRIGALKQRIIATKTKLENYLSGKIDSIDELNEELLCFMGNGKDFEKDFDQCEYRFLRMTSVNVNN